MTNGPNENIWKLLTKYNFQLDDENILDVFCSICHRILVKPFVGACGCQYCHKCIESHINIDGSHCPGSKCDRRDINLVMNDNVVSSFITSRKIETLVVKCPNESCTCTYDLGRIDEHLRLCGLNPTICPYKSIGCGDDDLTMNTIRNHLDLEMCKHSELLTDSFDNLRNDVNNVMKVKVEDLSKDAERKEGMMAEMKEVIESLLQEKVQNASEINDLKEKCRQYDARIEDLCKQIQEVEILVSANKENTNRMLEMKTEALLAEIREIRFCEEGDFIWRIENFRLEDGFKRRSVPFYRNSFKMYLRLGQDETSLGLGCYLMHGEFDEYNEWPMRSVVTLALVDQDTLLPWRSEEYRWDTYAKLDAFCKTPDISANCIGNDDFVLVSEMEEAANIWRNHCLVVCFTVVACDTPQ